MLRFVALFVALLLVGGVVSCGSQNIAADDLTRGASAGEWYDGTAYWNGICEGANFIPVVPGRTFEQAYYGSDFESDFAAIVGRMNDYFGAMGTPGTEPGGVDTMGTPGTEPGGVDTMGTPGVEPGGVDTMNTTVENWGRLYWGL